MENLIKGFKENKAFRITSLLVLLLILITVLAPVIAPYNPLEAVMRDANAAPSAAHLFEKRKPLVRPGVQLSFSVESLI